MTASLLKSVIVNGVDASGNVFPVKFNSTGYPYTNSLEYKTASAFETITVANTSVSTFTALTYGTSTKAFVTVEANAIRARWDGGTPTTSIGHLFNANTTIELHNTDIAKFKAIAVSAEAKLSVTYSS